MLSFSVACWISIRVWYQFLTRGVEIFNYNYELVYFTNLFILSAISSYIWQVCCFLHTLRISMSTRQLTFLSCAMSHSVNGNFLSAETYFLTWYIIFHPFIYNCMQNIPYSVDEMFYSLSLFLFVLNLVHYCSLKHFYDYCLKFLLDKSNISVI